MNGPVLTVFNSWLKSTLSGSALRQPETSSSCQTQLTLVPHYAITVLFGSPFTALPVCCLRKQGSSAPLRDGFNFYRPSRSRTSSFCFTICANHKASHKVKVLEHNSGSKGVAGGFQWVTCCINKICKVFCQPLNQMIMGLFMSS